MARLPLFVRIWFGLDLVLSLLPPIHWAISGGAPVFGLPRALAYLCGVSAFAALSLVAAYVAERPAARRRGA